MRDGCWLCYSWMIWTCVFVFRVLVTLGDTDQGDEFKIGIYRDTKYFSPVYRILGGQSRCMHEGGDAMVSAFVEIERVPGGAYTFTDVTLVLSGVPGGQLAGTLNNFNFGSCASKNVKLNIQYDEPCVDVRITDPSERFTN